MGNIVEKTPTCICSSRFPTLPQAPADKPKYCKDAERRSDKAKIREATQANGPCEQTGVCMGLFKGVV